MGTPDTSGSTAEFVELRLKGAAQVNFRAWFYPFVVAFAVMVLVARQPAGRYGSLPAWSLLLAYMSLACTFWPWPTTWLVMFAAVPDGLGLDPVAVAAVCTVGTCAANLHDYYVVTFLYRYRPVRRIRRTRLYERAAAWFDRAPFTTLTAASFLPIPIDLVRLLAISQGYSRWRFTAASALGRAPRYLLLALFAERFSLGWQWILAVLVVTVLIGLWRGVPRIARTLKAFRAREGEA